MKRLLQFFSLMLPILLSLGPAPLATSDSARASEKDPHDATSHRPFDDVEQWVKVFDHPSRDQWQKPEAVIRALELSPGMVVADLGAGTGYFSQYLARGVGPQGWVLVVDTEPEMVRHLGQRARKEGTANVVPILADPDDPFLPEGKVDRVLIVDTYHHIDDRLGYFARMKKALTPEGRLIVIDFFKRPLPVGPPPAHKLERGFVVEEMREAGWILSKEEHFLPYQYFLVFQPMSLVKQ